MYEAAIFVDIERKLITIAILDEMKILFFSEDKSYNNNPKNVMNSDFSDWFSNAENSVVMNKE